ncbi:MAG: 6-carboxytetrahydropterin synthase QueD [Candidatus Heimdallarchaeaceae archaeon]
MTFRIRKKFRFEAAHRLSSGYSKDCVNFIHGHSYVVELFIEAEKLNEDGMVIDFGLIKKLIKPIIDEWDHKLILHSINHSTPEAKVLVPFNPTAENMAIYLYDRSNHAMYAECQKYNISISKVRVHETDSGYAEYFEESENKA